ncbi:hypothetical protein D3C83_23940 [compost metagenome]
MDLTDEQWALLKPIIPEVKSVEGVGRPPADFRRVLDGILWILRTGAPWKDLPERYGAKSTVHRWFQEWRKQKVMERMLRTLAEDLRKRGGLDVSECFIDGTFASAKKGAAKLARPSAARGPRSWPWQTALVFLSPYARKALRPPK